jgi:hypothetical protein
MVFKNEVFAVIQITLKKAKINYFIPNESLVAVSEIMFLSMLFLILIILV